MIPEIGNFLLCLALALAVLAGVCPLWGAQRDDLRLLATARPLTLGVFLAVAGAFTLLVWCFISNDFTVAYVAANSNDQLPLGYRIAATWGAHEGSLLLWVLLLNLWAVAVARFSRSLPLTATARVLAVMGLINIGLLLFIIMTSNPFLRTLPDFPINGSDLNPLLQDIGLIFHPPLLYMGYVGFAVVFAFAIASLLTGELDTAWARWSRPWTLAAWVFLTLGIVLGSVWAYNELGWGGFWFWDPVENASLMPWLSGTALIHTLAVTEKRGSFKSWTVLLAIATFALCLLGTFLVRSGVLISVHAFTSDPARGLFILLFLLVVVGGSLLLYALKAGQVRSRVQHELCSRESFLLGNNVVLMAALFVVLSGTLLPLVHQQLGLGSLSVGAPFFNSMFRWLLVPFALLLGVAPLIRWRRDSLRPYRRRLLIAFIASVALALLLLRGQHASIVPGALIGLTLAFWIAILTLEEGRLRATHRHTLWRGLRSLSRSQWGMMLAHLGLAVTVLGIVFSQNYSIERDVRLAPGEQLALRDYQFTFRAVQPLSGPNYSGMVALIDVARHGKPVVTLRPEKRYYTASKAVMTEAAVDGGFSRDLYVALGEALGDGAFAFRLYYKPFMRWIWWGGLLMACGGVVCMLDPRYRLFRRSSLTGEKSHES